MGREHVAEKIRGARAFVTAFVSSAELGDDLWQQIANDYGDRWRFDAVLSVGCIATSAILRCGAEACEEPREITRQLLLELETSLDAAATQQLHEAIGLVLELMRDPRDQARLDKAVSHMGEQHGVFALEALAKVAQSALLRLASTAGCTPLEALQALAILDEMGLRESQED